MNKMLVFCRYARLLHMRNNLGIYGNEIVDRLAKEATQNYNVT